MKKILLIILCFIALQFSKGQDLSIPSSQGPSVFTTGTGDGASLITYNAILKLHNGLTIGSPYASDGNGGYIDKATIIFDGRSGNIGSIGQFSSSSTISNSMTSNCEFYFPTFNDYRTNSLVRGTGDGASLTTYNTIFKLHSGLAIGSPFVSDGNGGYVDKATIVFDGRSGNITSLGIITSKKIHCSEVTVDVNIPADYVFKSDYKLMSLKEVEQFVKTNSHLPEIPSANEIKEKGFNVGEMQNKLLQKVEELTLYIIEQDKKIKLLEEKLK